MRIQIHNLYTDRKNTFEGTDHEVFDFLMGKFPRQQRRFSRYDELPQLIERLNISQAIHIDILS